MKKASHEIASGSCLEKIHALNEEVAPLIQTISDSLTAAKNKFWKEETIVRSTTIPSVKYNFKNKRSGEDIISDKGHISYQHSRPVVELRSLTATEKGALQTILETLFPEIQKAKNLSQAALSLIQKNNLDESDMPEVNIAKSHLDRISALEFFEFQELGSLLKK
ncbi:MAG: hypothetical protein ACOYK6_01180 [Chthoniobacterales bacterium]